ncbi:MAG TPA: AsnC family transcriptional regulator, partial [Actinomycetota bacterium]|nr:AsnC family transcriptional regulator [Actinomycetota bacterium]
MLDDRDLDIIAALQEDARATYADVGRRVGLA